MSVTTRAGRDAAQTWSAGPGWTFGRDPRAELQVLHPAGSFWVRAVSTFLAFALLIFEEHAESMCCTTTTVPTTQA
jgi:hypothetical protein